MAQYAIVVNREYQLGFLQGIDTKVSTSADFDRKPNVGDTMTVVSSEETYTDTIQHVGDKLD